ncbi:hypothetical protein M0R45_013021 [Rubus argutus]|uniref:Uncharacterized protein n=1 Tax=Rubus argutus TaxID=59490 RepID=A0AAW1XHH8_RUBAR
MAGVQNLLKNFAILKLFTGKRIAIKLRRRGFRVLANSTRWLGGSRNKGSGNNSTRSSIPSEFLADNKPTRSSIPSEVWDDTFDYINDNTGSSGGDIVLEVRDLEDRCPPHLSRCAGLSELYGDEKKAVEVDCQQGLKKQGAWKIKRVFEVQNIPETCSQFEEYRLVVMAKSQANEINFSGSEEENRRGVGMLSESVYCRANGNELQRYYGTTVSCSLSSSSSSSSTVELCNSVQCGLCFVLGHGLGPAVTTSSAVMALKDKDVTLTRGQNKKAVIVCRVIAGRVRPRLCSQWKVAPAPDEFDTFALSNHDLCVQYCSAILPCSVVIYEAN